MTDAAETTRPPPAATSMRRDLLSAYVASAARIGSWAIISAAVFRLLGPGPFAVMALVRGTIGLLNYTTLGLAPAMVHLLAAGDRARSGEAEIEIGENPVLPALPLAPQGPPTLGYASAPPRPLRHTAESLYAN